MNEGNACFYLSYFYCLKCITFIPSVFIMHSFALSFPPRNISSSDETSEGKPSLESIVKWIRTQKAVHFHEIFYMRRTNNEEVCKENTALFIIMHMFKYLLLCLCLSFSPSILFYLAACMDCLHSPLTLAVVILLIGCEWTVIKILRTCIPFFHYNLYQEAVLDNPILSSLCHTPVSYQKTGKTRCEGRSLLAFHLQH